MAKIMIFIVAALMTLLVAPSDAEMLWDTTYGKSPGRRLDHNNNVGTTASHSNTSDPACIVGGYDSDHPTRVYVGGPCSLIENGQPKAGFKYVVMETFWAELQRASDGATADMTAVADSEFAYSTDAQASHAEAGAFVDVKFEDTDISNARLFLSTTSYLSKADFTFTKNTFLVNKPTDAVLPTDLVSDVCVTPCAATPAGGSKTCTTCPAEDSAEAMPVNKGDYKYSILAAAHDAAFDKGWQAAIAKYSVAPATTLEGYLNVYQAIDFTAMQADTLTITGTQGSTTYANMKPCNTETGKDAADANADCQYYSVAAITVESDEWKGSYAFPLTYNYGTWTRASETSVITPAHEGTNTVMIHCVRPTAANIQSDIPGAPANSKVIYLQYKFDVSGISAMNTAGTGYPATGKYMVYDPTIKTVDPSNPSSPSSPSTTAAPVSIACQPAVGLFMIIVLAVLNVFA